ncbi:coiled-coil domain-containing protein 39 [Drosophila guanche]|uniref:Coiled-coil domain-containing protein 39 n=1 Tax=Drosophila guanche TaxID=7266 RepID=A0A3B0KE56_DROGU|nr:coiled-coil domain-containing protein 39 [Drosophila guanche]SPP84569.1 blast:Coiled-coil domain-containing protein 39 [Drosophila guanche]
MNETDDIKAASLDDFKMEAMASMGWTVDADIPMANAENLAILKELEGMRLMKLELMHYMNMLDERDQAVVRHAKNIEGTIQQNETLYNSLQKDVVKEAHRVQLVILERHKIKEDLRKTQKELEEYTEYAEFTQRKICLNRREIDDLTSRIKSAKTTLMEWTEAMEDGNKGYQLIEKYYLDDQQKARELNTRRQQLQADIDKRRKLVVQLYDEQNTLEKNLERTACLYRAAHVERRQMVETWKNAVNQMTQRENDIQRSESECAMLMEEAGTIAQQYKQQDQQLDEVIENNRQVEYGIEALNTETSDMKNLIQQVIDAAILKDREIDSLRKELENLSNRVHVQRMENRNLVKQREAKKQEIEGFTAAMEQVTGRLKSLENKALNADQRLKILEDMMESEEEMLKNLEKEQQKVNDLLFRTQRQVTELKDEEKTLQVQNDSLACTLAALKRNQRQVNHELQRQTEIHYNLCFKFLKVERRYALMSGSQDDPEVEERNLKILSNLEHEYEKLQRLIATTEAQNKKLNYNMNNMVIQYNADEKELDMVRFKIKEAQVYCEGTVKRLRMNRFENSERIVELNMVKMRCSDLEIGIGGCDQGSFDLEQHRIIFQRAIKDRTVELRSQEDVLQLKRKHLNEELSTLKADLGERRKQIEAMRSRFELTSRLLGKNDDGSLVTSTQLKVESAQSRQLMADEGDALNKKVLKAEQEVIALENTLRQFDRSNNNFRKTFEPADENSKDRERAEAELKQLEEAYARDVATLKQLRCKKNRYDQKLTALKGEEDDLITRLEGAKRQRGEHTEELEKLQRDLDDQRTKLERANREIRMQLREIKQRPISEDFLEHFERDLNLQELEARNSKALNMLVDMANSDENGPEIIDQLLQKGLKLPQHLKRTRSCVSWKTPSSSSQDAGSYISAAGKGFLAGISARSSASDLSSLKDDSSSASVSGVSIISLEFPKLK